MKILKERPKFPTKKEVITAIKELEEVSLPDVKTTNYEEHYKKLNDVFIKHFNGMHSVYDHPAYSELNFPLYRVRPLYSPSYPDLGLIREYSYPPIDKVGLNRCNYKRKPVFYCSQDPRTAILETIKEENTEVTFCISVWENQTQEAGYRYRLASFLQSVTNENNPAHSIKMRAHQLLVDKLKEENVPENEIEGVVTLRQYFHDAFVDPNSYNISAFLAHKSIFKEETDVLLYPSVQSNGNSYNLAISPNFADNHLRFKRCYIGSIEIYDRKNFGLKLKMARKGFIENNRIKTIGFDPKDEEFIIDIKRYL